MKKSYLESLKGISYRDWQMLKTAVDRTFEHEKGEFEKEIKLADTQITETFIRQQFGRTLD